MLLDALRSDSPAVLVSLPRNDPELARAAVDAGAAAVKVHVNVTHRASGRSFGSVEEEGEAIREIGALNVPVGVVPGEDVETIHETLPALSDLPVDYVDAYAHHLPPEAIESTDLSTWIGPTSEYNTDEILALERTGADVLEASLISKGDYGQAFTAAHAARYTDLADRASLPVVVPTQLALRPEDAAYLADRGVTNFLLGAIVMDATPESVFESTEAFVEPLE